TNLIRWGLRMSRYLVVILLGLPLTLLLAAEKPAPVADAPGSPVGDELQAGFAETDITPVVKDKTVYMAGFGHNRKATGIHDPLKVRAVVLHHGADKIALVSVDLVGFFQPQVESVRRRLPGFRYVLVSSTHNHEGPDTLGLWGASAFRSGIDAEYLASVEKQIVEAGKTADAPPKPLTARIGPAQTPQLLRDPRAPYVKPD